MRLAEELGVFATTELSELFQIPDLDIIIDLSEDPSVARVLGEQKPEAVEVLGGRGSEMVWDLLVAKKRGEEQEKLFVELQVAYDKIRSHERQLQASKEALEQWDEFETHLPTPERKSLYQHTIRKKAATDRQQLVRAVAQPVATHPPTL